MFAPCRSPGISPTLGSCSRASRRSRPLWTNRHPYQQHGRSAAQFRFRSVRGYLDEQFQVMVLSVIMLTDRVLPGMRAPVGPHYQYLVGRHRSHSQSGSLQRAAQPLVGWSKTLAREVAPEGITANIILPGRIATSRIRFLDEQKAKRESRTLDSVVDESTAAIPMGRYGRPEEYGDVVAFLASERASYITGSIIRVDGGYIASI